MLIERFSEALRAGEPERLTALMAEDIVFYASIPSEPFIGREAVVFVFGMLQEVCEEIEYVAQYGEAGDASSRRGAGCKGGSSMAPRFCGWMTTD